MDPTRWWFEPWPEGAPVHSFTVARWLESHAGDERVAQHGTIELELQDEDERAWSMGLGRTWRVRGDGENRVLRLNGPLAVSRNPVGHGGLPERQTWRWERVEAR